MNSFGGVLDKDAGSNPTLAMLFFLLIIIGFVTIAGSRTAGNLISKQLSIYILTTTKKYRQN
jgi:hypothetical protein